MLINYSKIFKENLFDKTQKEKEIFFFNNLKKLHNYHQKNSKEYLNISKTLFKKNMNKIENLPFLHVQMFKEKNLKSVQSNVNVKMFNSSGTSGKKLSMINIDMKTSLLQAKVLNRILLSVLREKVDKIYFIDSETTLKTMRNSARGAAILGFKQIANSFEFILDSKYKVKKKNYKKNNCREKKNLFFWFHKSCLVKFFKLSQKK